MLARTVTVEDNTSLASYSRCIDTTSTFGDSYRKTRVMAHRSTRDGVQTTYLFFYNLSPDLPINLNVANLIGETPSNLNIQKRLFWRGDVVVMKVQSTSESINSMVESLDADLFDLRSLEEFLQEKYRERIFECLLHDDERKCEQECR